MLKDFFESRLIASTESVESGIFDFDLDDFQTAAKMNIGDTIEGILTAAQQDNRIICGLSDASRHLKESDSSENSLFFFVAPSPVGDSLTHMTEVFLQAFCFENDIYIVKLDCAQKLSQILNSQTLVTCALTQKKTQSQVARQEKYTDLEKVLIDHCENFWDEPVQPIIRLPEK
jgi:growth arrest and DNA-damage-inducible protein